MGVSRIVSRSLVAAAAVLATALVPLAPRAAATPPESPEDTATTRPEISMLDLRVTPGDRTKDSKAAILRCDPAGGTHPRATVACEQLAAVHGEFESLRAGKAKPMCPLVYRPVTVTATGTWKNSPVRYSQTYSNACEMRAYTGKVFAL
ncbi:SSI family serine proteinase inhibitor [Actinopolyspora mortivallis]|uniref:SSI family serine proteinase inhibitor n=1 Tax=Actinopolyspora mortivallis TaxID=33906 RepID=UPI00047A5670|nr:SSI family serine proteinase inhibitor [Actinopolyspora mortivallis]